MHPPSDARRHARHVQVPVLPRSPGWVGMQDDAEAALAAAGDLGAVDFAELELAPIFELLAHTMSAEASDQVRGGGRLACNI